MLGGEGVHVGEGVGRSMLEREGVGDWDASEEGVGRSMLGREGVGEW